MNMPMGTRMTVAVIVNTAMTAPITVDDAPKVIRYKGISGRVTWCARKTLKRLTQVSEKSLSQFFVWEAAGSANLRAVSGKVRSDHHCGAGEAKSMFMTKSKSRITPISIFPRRRGRSGEILTLSFVEVIWCRKQRGINRHL
jgi:hypothetical protein